MTKLNSLEQKLDQAFRLAHFIHRDKVVARSIAIDAVSRLDATMAAQDKRLGHESEKRYTIFFTEDHMLQRLVMISSDPYEREFERNREKIDQQRLLVHFIKHLVRTTYKLTPFHTTLGVCRILHNYSTGETLEIDGIVMQDRDGGKDPSYLRAKKSSLISELQERFGDLISQCEGPRKEIRFHCHDNPRSFIELTHGCLGQLAPWFTDCINIPSDYNPADQVLDDLSSDGKNFTRMQRIQINRLHAALDPKCFSLLVKGLREHSMRKLEFNEPDHNLQIPIFNISNDDPPDDGDQNNASGPPDLSDAELAAMRRELEQEAAIRNQWGKGLLRIIVDGRERARFNTGKPEPVKLRLDGGEELIEVFGEVDGNDTLLAARLLSYDDDLRLTDSGFYIRLPDETTLSFNFDVGEPSEEGYSPVNIVIIAPVEEAGQAESRRVDPPQPGWLAEVAQLLRDLVARPALPTATLAILLMLAGGYYIMTFIQPAAQDELLAELYETFKGQRPYESRITGLDYARFSVTRGGSETGLDPNDVELAKMKWLEAVKTKKDARSYYGLGLFYLMNRDLDNAIGNFRTALSMNDKDAKIHGDLGAALLEKGKDEQEGLVEDEGAAEFGESYEHLSEALNQQPDMPEALFNRAICEEYLGLHSEAIEDWQRYLEIDPDSKWAVEAKARLEALRQAQKDHSRIRELQLQSFYAAYHANDPEAAWTAISGNRELITESIIWQQVLAEFFRHMKNGDMVHAKEALRAMFWAGVVEEQKVGDGFVRDLAIYYQGLSPAEWRKLAAAHDLMRDGNLNFINAEFDRAADSYSSAAKKYEALDDKWESIISRYIVEYCRLLEARNREPSAFLALLEETEYPWMQAQIHNALGMVYTNITQTTKGIEHTSTSLQISESLKDHVGIQKNECELVYQHTANRDTAKALRHFGRCMRVAGSRWPGYRQMIRFYFSANRIYLASNRKLTAETFSLAAFRLARDEMKDPAFIFSTALSLAEVYRRSGRIDEALRMCALGYKTAREHSGIEAFRPREAYSAGLLGAIYYDQKNYNQAIRFFTESIELHKELETLVNWHEGLKGRFLASIAAGNDRQAYADLEEIRKSSESYRQSIQTEGQRNSFFSREQEFTDEAIDFLLDRGDSDAAFDLAESTSARSLLDLVTSNAGVTSEDGNDDFSLDKMTAPLSREKIQAGMPDKAVILRFAVLKNRIAIWVLSKNNLETVPVDIPQVELNERVTAYNKLIADYRKATYAPGAVRSEAEWFYRMLITPVEKHLEKAGQICIIPDKTLNYLPFLTLRKPGQGEYLVRLHSITFMPSLTTFLHCTNRARHLLAASRSERLLGIGISTLEKARFAELDPLLNARYEVMSIAKYYPGSLSLINQDARKAAVTRELQRSEVVHIASHYIAEKSSPMQSQLLLAHDGGRGSTTETLKAGEIYSVYKRGRSKTRLAVLSVCDSGIEKYFDGEGMIGMARIFIASDIPLVVASLWKVDSEATGKLMIDFHLRRKQGGLSTAEALRRAQIGLIDTGDEKYSRPGYWAGFILIGGYAEY